VLNHGPTWDFLEKTEGRKSRGTFPLKLEIFIMLIVFGGLEVLLFSPLPPEGTAHSEVPL
jgi:hypothetical protein